MSGEDLLARVRVWASVLSLQELREVTRIAAGEIERAERKHALMSEVLLEREAELDDRATALLRDFDPDGFLR